MIPSKAIFLCSKKTSCRIITALGIGQSAEGREQSATAGRQDLPSKPEVASKGALSVDLCMSCDISLRYAPCPLLFAIACPQPTDCPADKLRY
jgi:hypothetical protein